MTLHPSAQDPSAQAFEAIAADATEWRRDFHRHPEVLYAVERTAGRVAELLRSFGCDDVVTGVGRTGVVGLIHGRKGQRVVGFRADMDALPITEETNLPYRSQTPGRMHACGHDGHTAMLLGAAKHLAATRDFDGTVAVIFQPAEEGGAGARTMIEDGLMDRFGIDEVYGMHNVPGMPVGQFAVRAGPIMAAADQFTIEIEGRGSHAAQPHLGVDPIVIASHVVTALQSIVSRAVNPLEAAVVSVTAIQAGDTFNVIPQTANLKGTVRSLSDAVAALCEQRIGVIANQIAGAFGASCRYHYRKGYPVTSNHAAQTEVAAAAARHVAGDVDLAVPPMMGAEDFSFMLNARPGAYLFIGNGDSASLHHPSYNFDDTAIPAGIAYWTALAERKAG